MGTRRMIDNMGTIHSSEKRWFAIKTKFKAEKFVSRRLNDQGIECFVPLIKRQRLVGSSIRQSEVPLIYNYAFVHIGKSDYVSVLQTQYVISYVKIGSELKSIPNDEIDILKRIVGSPSDVDIADNVSFNKGDEVHIISGDLTGLVGYVLAQENQDWFIIELKNIGIHLRISVNKSQLILGSCTV